MSTWLTTAEWVLAVLTIYRFEDGEINTHLFRYDYQTEQQCYEALFTTEAHLLDKVQNQTGYPLLTSYSVECRRREVDSLPGPDTISETN